MLPKVLQGIVVSALSLSVVATSRSAQTQTDPAAARELFDQARNLVAQQKYVEACPKFEQSDKLDHGIGVVFNLADCWQHLGRTASAWAKFRDVADEAARTNQKEREEVASRRAAELLPQLSKLVVHIEAKDPGLEVRRDGVAILISAQGAPFTLDPGEHRIEAKAPGKQPWSTTVSVPPNGQIVEMVVPALVAEGSTRPDDKPIENVQPGVVLGGGTKTEPNRDKSTSPSHQKTLAYVTGGVGVAGIAVGTIFGLRVSSKNSTADSICPSSKGCTAQDQTDIDSVASEARGARTVAFVGFGVGGAAIISGAILYFTAPKSKPTAMRFSPAFQVGQVGGSLQGAW